MHRSSLGIVCVAIVLLAVSFARLRETLAQVRAIEAPGAMSIAVRERLPPEPSEPAVPAPQTATSSATFAAESPAHEARVDDDDGDEHIMRALAADAEFARAAALLLQDPDSAVRAEAQLLLRELGL